MQKKTQRKRAPGAGRPPVYDGARVKRYSIALTSEQYAELGRIGRGNASRAVRELLDATPVYRQRGARSAKKPRQMSEDVENTIADLLDLVNITPNRLQIFEREFDRVATALGFFRSEILERCEPHAETIRHGYAR